MHVIYLTRLDCALTIALRPQWYSSSDQSTPHAHSYNCVQCCSVTTDVAYKAVVYTYIVRMQRGGTTHSAISVTRIVIAVIDQLQRHQAISCANIHRTQEKSYGGKLYVL
jgi:hypothetical protein